jgi:enoyl-CoA hydratase
MSEDLVVERHGNVLLLRLNRPEKRNALNFVIMDGLGRSILDAESDPDIRAVVITGTGDRTFCAGMDLAEFAQGGASSDAEAAEALARFVAGGATVPVIGAANASALGGGLEILLGCDVIVASSAAKFGLPEVKRGLFPGGGGTAIGRRIPLGAALELLLTGDPIDAARAYALGLVNIVAEPEQVVAAALDVAERIAANAPLALAACKELALLATSDAAAFPERLVELRTAVFASDDAKEGAAAFVEKRTPVWRGT